MPTPFSAPRPGRATRARRRAVVARAAALLAVLTVLVAPAAAAATTATATSTSTRAVADAAASGTGVPIVLIGVTGLRWDDLGTLTTPALWSMSRDGAVGTTVVRSVRPSACPADGWLAVSAGTRAGDVPASDGTCRSLREPATGATVPGWLDYTAAAEQSSYAADLGVLGDALVSGGATATGIGPGAAIALADSAGLPVGEHIRLPSDPTALTRLVREAIGTSDLVVVDAGSVRDPGHATRDRGTIPTVDGEEPAELGPDDEALPPALTPVDAVTKPTRGEQSQSIDARVRAVLAGVAASRSGATVLVVSLADSSRSPHLQLAVASGPVADGDGSVAYADALLGSQSTRQDGFVQATDVTPTLLSALGLRGEAPTGSLVGSPITAVGGPGLASARVAGLVDADIKSQVVRPLIPSFYLAFVGINLVLYALVTVAINGRVLGWGSRLLDRRWPDRRFAVVGASVNPRAVLRPLRLASVAVAAIPVATFLANLVPWWRTSAPSVALTVVIVGWVAAISAVALLPRWRSWPLGPVGVVAAITAVVVSVDVATGGNLQLTSVMGTQPLVAGRFYGFNNTAFSLVAASSILATTALTNPLVARGRRKLAALVVVAIGVLVTVLDGWPSIGADFGGPPSLVPGFAVLALLAAGVRLNWFRAIGVLAAGALTVTVFAVLDWLRPADSRTHLGRFVDTVLDGGLWTVVERKLQGNLRNLFGSELTLLAFGGLVLVILVLSRPFRSAVAAPHGGDYGWLTSRAPLNRLGTVAPMLSPGLIALAVTFGIGFALNDSGIAIPAIGVGLAVPLLVTASTTWMLRLLDPEAEVSVTDLRGVAEPIGPASQRSGPDAH